MKKLKFYTYLKIIAFLLLMFVAIAYPKNVFDVIIADLIEIKSISYNS